MPEASAHQHHGHDHGHHHGHRHAHAHAQGGHRHAAAHAVALAPTASLLRLSALQRLAGAALLSALLWALVYWALS